MDMFDGIFGSSSSPEERQAEADRLLKEVKFDHILKGGKVYINAEELARTFRSTSGLIALRALLTGDRAAGLNAPGMAVAGEIVTDIYGELLRREAAAILDEE